MNFKFQMRHLFLVLDMSSSMGDQDLKPTRLLATLKVKIAKTFMLILIRIDVSGKI